MVDYIETIKEQKDEQGNLIGYLVNGVMSVPKSDRNRQYADVKEWIAAGNTAEAFMSDEEIEAKRKAAITAKADDIIYTAYPQKKQNKLQSQAVKLTLIQAKGGILSDSEQILENEILAIDTWITNIRAIENAAIADGILLADVVWE